MKLTLNIKSNILQRTHKHGDGVIPIRTSLKDESSGKAEKVSENVNPHSPSDNGH
jgi:hypothetical protein